MPETPAADDTLRAALHGVRGLLLDLDGVLVLAGKAVPGAPEALAALDRRGVPVPRGDQHLAGLAPFARGAGVEASASRRRRTGSSRRCPRRPSSSAASTAIARSFVIASDDALAEFAGLNVVDAAGVDADPEAVAAVVLGDSPDQLTKANLDRAFRLVRGGAALIGMHRNPWWLTPEGPTLDAGAFLVALEWATGRKARIVGKPAPAFFRVAIDRLAAEAAARGEPRLGRGDLAMVGDDVGSDIRGGRRAGLRTVFVRSGKHGDAELTAAASGTRGYAPDAVAPSIAEVVAALD